MAKLNPPRTVAMNATTATLISDGTYPWRKRVIRNTDAAISVFIGTSTVDKTGANKGHEVKFGEIWTEQDTADPIYGMSASGTPSVSVLEIGG
jgi:hypothetical protein